MRVRVRRAELGDVDGIYLTLRLAFEEYRKIGYSEAAIQSAVVSKSEIRRRIGEEFVLIAEVDGQVVGTVTGAVEYGCMHVKSLATRPGFQNLGVARRLMERIEREASDAKCFKMSLTSTPAMESAIHLYEKLGYCVEGVLKKQFHGLDFIVFGKVLKS